MTVNYYGHTFTLHQRKDAPVKHLVAYDIYGAYERPSIRKVEAWKACEQMCRDCDGEGLCITGTNTMAFSVMFDFLTPDGEWVRAHITRDYNHLYYL